MPQEYLDELKVNAKQNLPAEMAGLEEGRKRCRTCKIEKTLREFQIRKDTKSRVYRPACRICRSKENFEWKKNNKSRARELNRISWLKNKKSANDRRRKKYYLNWEFARERGKKSYIKHKDKRSAQATIYREKNKERIKIKARIWQRNNRHKTRAAWQKRNCAKIKATPRWANLRAIEDIYKKAVELGLEVDHIVPLQNPLVCGLHVEGNLQLLAKKENAKKGNKFIPFSKSLI